MKIPRGKQPKGEGGIIFLTVLDRYIPSWPGKHGSKQGHHGGRSRRLAGHTTSTLRTQRVKSEARPVSLKASLPSEAPPPIVSTTFPNSITSGGPSVGTHEPVGGGGASHIQTTTANQAITVFIN